MLHPNTIVDAVVEHFRSISLLVSAMDGNTEKISAYHDAYPRASNIQKAFALVGTPGTMVFWSGMESGFVGDVESYIHHIGAYVRSAPTVDPETNASVGFEEIAYALVGGGDLPRLVDTDILRECQRPSIPTVQRRTDASGVLEYLEISFDLPEIGDN